MVESNKSPQTNTIVWVTRTADVFLNTLCLIFGLCFVVIGTLNDLLRCFFIGTDLLCKQQAQWCQTRDDTDGRNPTKHVCKGSKDVYGCFQK